VRSKRPSRHLRPRLDDDSLCFCRHWVPCPRLSWACAPRKRPAWPRKRGHGTRYTEVKCDLDRVWTMTPCFRRPNGGSVRVSDCRADGASPRHALQPTFTVLDKGIAAARSDSGGHRRHTYQAIRPKGRGGRHSSQSHAEASRPKVSLRTYLGNPLAGRATSALRSFGPATAGHALRSPHLLLVKRSASLRMAVGGDPLRVAPVYSQPILTKDLTACHPVGGSRMARRGQVSDSSFNPTAITCFT
jgi:hypothetical protein